MGDLRLHDHGIELTRLIHRVGILGKRRRGRQREGKGNAERVMAHDASMVVSGITEGRYAARCQSRDRLMSARIRWSIGEDMGRDGFEPSTYGLKVRSSTTELTTHREYRCCRDRRPRSRRAGRIV